jgi:Holliday junction resolvase RusA-like endonuclease
MRSFFWAGQPRGQGRPRFNRQIGAYKSSEDKAYERALCMAYWEKHSGKRPLEGPLTIKITAVFPIPKSKPKREQELMRSGEIKPTCKPDMDNIQKSVLDALNKVAFPDDKAVTWLIGKKVYGDVPGIHVEIDGVEML